MKTLSILPLLMLLLSGCVGVALHTETHNYSSPFSRLDDEVSRHKLSYDTLREQDVVRLLGEPRRRTMNDKGEISLEYPADVAWRGVTLWLILPVPLLLPVGHNTATIKFFADGRHASTLVEGTGNDFIGCTIAACGHLGEPHG